MCWKNFGFGAVAIWPASPAIDPLCAEAAAIRRSRAALEADLAHHTLPRYAHDHRADDGADALGNVLNAGFDQVYNTYSPIVAKWATH
ncbi:MAG: hypothetical protein ACLUE8_16075 [Lachnospiraceae bacterium]